MIFRHPGQESTATPSAKSGNEKGVHLKILLVSDHYPPFIGGAHRQTQLLAKEFHQRGHEVSVATVWHGGFPEIENEGGVMVYRLKQLRTVGPWVKGDRKQRHQSPFPDPITIIGLRRLINQFKPDIIHSYGWISYSCAAALTGKNIPMLLSARDYAYGCANQTLLLADGTVCSGPRLNKCLNCAASHYGKPKGWVTAASIYLGRSLLRRKISGVHSISTYVQQIMQRDFLGKDGTGNNQPGKKVPEAIIPSFQEDSHEGPFQPDAEILRYIEQLPNEPYILFVGALRRVKGVDQLLAAYQKLNSPLPLVLIGTLEADSPKKFPPGVHVLTNFPHAAVMEAWGRCAFGVVPSLWPEPLGSVVYEGMSKGKAVIGTTPGGHTDMIIDHETGLLVPANDVNALASAMQTLIDAPELGMHFGRAGLEKAKSYTAGVTIPNFEKLYERVINDFQSSEGNAPV
jgi:glycosyltransferase involved in cell wall biosynthesis